MVCNRLFKMVYLVAIIKETLVKELAWLFRDNIWKLYELSKSMIWDREPQFAVELTKELNKMLVIKTKLLMFFHLQTDR